MLIFTVQIVSSPCTGSPTLCIISIKAFSLNCILQVQLACQMLLSFQQSELSSAKDLSMCAQLSSNALEAPGAREFLSFLGFDFQRDGAYDKDPFVVFPHWDPDGILSMSAQVLEAVCGM